MNRQQEPGRIEAAATAIALSSICEPQILAGQALAAVDRWDREHGYVRVKLDDVESVVERFAHALSCPRGAVLDVGACSASCHGAAHGVVAELSVVAVLRAAGEEPR